MKHPEDSMQSQYAASPVIRAVIDALNTHIDPAADIQLFHDRIFNILTAEGVGLDNWGRILGIGRILEVDVEDFFGFEGSSLEPFEQQSFYKQILTKNSGL